MQLTTSPRPLDADADYYYPDSDGRPVGETPVHFRNLRHLVDILEGWFAGEPQVYVAGNMFIYYARGDRLKHVSPDLFVVRGVPKDTPRRKYLLWEEGKGPDLVVELTSESTREEDVDDKKWLYRDILGVSEYVLFDPFGEYLQPPLMGFRLQEGDYVPMPIVSGRLPSEVLGLHLEADGENLRLYDPAAGRWLPTPAEVRELAAAMAADLDQTAAERDRALADKARLEQELSALRRQLAGKASSEQPQE